MNQADTIPGLALAAAQTWPDEPAIIDGDIRISFKELADRMRRAAAAFVAAGLQPGERVGLWAPNMADWVIACLGLQAAGGTLVPLNTRFKGVEVQYILNRSKAAMLVSIGHFLGLDYPAQLDGLDVPTLRRTVRLGEQDWQDFLDAATDADLAEADRRIAAVKPTDICDIMFTSGTTGNPKGAVANHGQTAEIARLWSESTSLTAGDRFLILWPFFHTSGYKAAWLVCIAVGATILPQASLDADELVGKVEREKVTFLPGPPPLFTTLLGTPDLDVKRLASIRVSVTGASSVAPTLIDDMRRKLNIPTVLTGYGLTETCGTATMTKHDTPAEIVAISCGTAIRGVEVKVADDDGNEVPRGEAGEVLIRGPNVMQGYLDDAQATAETIDPDGWLHSGDIGVMDEAGYLRITDRKKDIFIVGGFNCYPAEIERMLLAHAAILSVAVTGVPDERMGEVGKAYVVLKPGAALTAEELIAWSRDQMANFKVPRYVDFVAELPTNATGKVQKFKLDKTA